MAHEFQINKEITVDASPEQVWDAIATGPGIDSWFMGRNEVEPRLGGTVSQELFGETGESTITAWEPLKHLAYRSPEAEDGTFMAFELLIEGRQGSSTVVRFVHSGALGDDWEAEYDALQEGDGMYLLKLAQYVEHFQGRTSRHNVFAVGPQSADYPGVWAAFAGALGVSGSVSEGDSVRVAVDGLPPADGVVGFVLEPKFLGVRTDDSLYMFIHGFQDGVVVEQHIFGDIDGAAADQAWQSWLEATIA